MCSRDARAESPRAVCVQVELGLAAGDHLGDRPADASRASEAVEREPGRHVQAAHSRHWSDKRAGVRGHGVGVANELDDPGFVRGRKTARGARQQGLEPCLVGRQ
jgi:hypothetical protein